MENEPLNSAFDPVCIIANLGTETSPQSIEIYTMDESKIGAIVCAVAEVVFWLQFSFKSMQNVVHRTI